MHCVCVQEIFKFQMFRRSPPERDKIHKMGTYHLHVTYPLLSLTGSSLTVKPCCQPSRNKSPQDLSQYWRDILKAEQQSGGNAMQSPLGNLRFPASANEMTSISMSAISQRLQQRRFVQNPETN